MNDQAQTPQNASKTGMWVGILVVIAIIVAGAWYFLGQEDDTNTNNANTTVNSVANANSSTDTVASENVNGVVNTNEMMIENTNEATNTNTSSNTNAGVDTSDWDTYSNADYGYTLHYPQDWIHSFVYEDGDPNAPYEEPLHYSSITSADNHVRLLLGIERTGDIGTTYYRTGIGAGDIVAGDQLDVAGVSISTWQRIFEGRAVEVFLFPALNGVSPIAVAGHDITASFGIVDSDTYIVDITQTINYKAILEILSSIDFLE